MKDASLINSPYLTESLETQLDVYFARFLLDNRLEMTVINLSLTETFSLVRLFVILVKNTEQTNEADLNKCLLRLIGCF